MPCPCRVDKLVNFCLAPWLLRYSVSLRKFEWYKERAEQGEAPAQLVIGDAYGAGYGVLKDQHKAIEWWRKAAEQEHWGAQDQLGLCYANGEGVEQDHEQALEWFRKANDQDGRCYKTEEVQQQHDQTVESFSESADQGCSFAQHELALMYWRKWAPQDRFGLRQTIEPDFEQGRF
jgi:TPR repeat protein